MTMGESEASNNATGSLGRVDSLGGVPADQLSLETLNDALLHYYTSEVRSIRTIINFFSLFKKLN